MTTDIFFISIQSTYKTLALALFNNEKCLSVVASEEQRASSSLAPLLAEMLAGAGLELSRLSFLAVDVGPGAFTSLRVIIATVNGIAFASKIPLIGITSFEGLVRQSSCSRVLVLLNAFNNDIYAAYAHDGNIAIAGCVKYELLPELLAMHATSESVEIMGNGLQAYPQAAATLEGLFPSVTVSDIQIPSAESIGLCGYQKWLAGERSAKLQPAYLKFQAFAIQGVTPKN